MSLTYSSFRKEEREGGREGRSVPMTENVNLLNALKGTQKQQALWCDCG